MKIRHFYLAICETDLKLIYQGPILSINGSATQLDSNLTISMRADTGALSKHIHF